ncbi:flagellar biosynthesis protein FlaG [Asticcacaulis benevestitus]|nr:flagellar biosynthesis protein FlaG [Asticcacaulis benevestitus]
MINNVLSFPQVTNDVSQIKRAPDVPKEIASTSSSEPSKNDSQPDLSDGQNSGSAPAYLLRLTVDKDPKTGDWVYKAIDRYTGEVVRVMPRQELVEMRKSTSYKAGSVINTDA